MLTTNGTNPWSFATQIFLNDQPSHGGDSNFLCDELNFTTNKILGRVASLLTATLYHGNHKLWNIISTPYTDAGGMLLHFNWKF